MKTRLRKLFDSLKSSYWFVPVVMMALALILWSGTNTLDYHMLSAKDKRSVTWLYVGDVDSMRTLLLTIAGAIIGIVGVVFSIIMVPLSIAATQFGPRLLRTFLRDTGTQVTLGTFTATFIFCMAVLLRLSDKANQSLPQISVNVALLLGLMSFAVLLYFINHVAVSIQAPVLVSKVSKELHRSILHQLSDDPDPVPSQPAKNGNITPDFTSAGSPVMASGSGYIQVLDHKMLVDIATQHNIVLQLLSQPGDFLAEGTPLAIVWPEISLSRVTESINEAFILGSQRTLVQDVGFGINELVEVAIRALSPAINDPFTAMTCLDWLGSALCQTCTSTFPLPKLYDHQGDLRVIRSPVTFTRLTGAAFNQIREYGRTSMAVTLRLMETIKVVAQCARTEEQRKALLHHAILIERGCQIGLPEEHDRLPVIACYETIKDLLETSK